MKWKRKYVGFGIGIVLCVVIAWIIWGNKALELTCYPVESDYLPAEFGGYRIAHISDLHNTEIGTSNEILLAMLENAEPDMIAITGDMIDSRNTNVDIALRFAEEAAGIAPCCYVTGNHEARVSEYSRLKEGLLALGVIVLENEAVELRRQEAAITILGVDDPNFHIEQFSEDSKMYMKNQLLEQMDTVDGYTVLLSHRPELFEVYAEAKVDMVLSGHAHGGQFRLPFVGGLIAPHQGIFPKYDAGTYTEERTTMVVSRGIGNSIFPFRFNNRPEVVLVTLQQKIRGEQQK